MSVTEFKSNPIKTIFRFQFGYHKMPMDYPLNPIRQFPILSHRNLSLIIVRTLTESIKLKTFSDNLRWRQITDDFHVMQRKKEKLKLIPSLGN